MPFLKEEKSEHERARTPMLAVQPCCARHCELPLSKMGNKGLFPGVAVPLAFFCTLFFRHRKKSVSAPWDGQSQSAPESARQSPPRGFAYGKVVAYRCKQGAFRSPPAPLRGVGVSTGREYVPAGAPKGLPRGKTIGAARAAVHSACCFSDFKVLTTLSALVSISTISLQ